MRLASLACILLVIVAPRAEAQESPPVLEASMPLHMYREEGQPLEMDGAFLIAGQFRDSFFLKIDFNNDGAVLGAPWNVLGQIALGNYCRNEDSGVRAVLITNSTGEVWKGRRFAVGAGPRGYQRWAEGFSDDPDLFSALAAGGTVTLALQDDDGRLWNTVTIDTLSPARREQLYADNLEVFRTTEPATVPVVTPPPPLQLVERAPVPRTPPPPPQLCP
jgi:hypothetical protein